MRLPSIRETLDAQPKGPPNRHVRVEEQDPVTGVWRIYRAEPAKQTEPDNRPSIAFAILVGVCIAGMGVLAAICALGARR